MYKHEWTWIRVFILPKILFSFNAIDSPRRFFILFFSNLLIKIKVSLSFYTFAYRLQAYSFPVARTWQAHTSPKPPLPSTLYCRKFCFVTARFSKSFHWINRLNFRDSRNSLKGLSVVKRSLTVWYSLQSIVCSLVYCQLLYSCEVIVDSFLNWFEDVITWVIEILIRFLPFFNFFFVFFCKCWVDLGEAGFDLISTQRYRKRVEWSWAACYKWDIPLCQCKSM